MFASPKKEKTYFTAMFQKKDKKLSDIVIYENGIKFKDSIFKLKKFTFEDIKHIGKITRHCIMRSLGLYDKKIFGNVYAYDSKTDTLYYSKMKVDDTIIGIVTIFVSLFVLYYLASIIRWTIYISIIYGIFYIYSHVNTSK